MMGKTWEPQKRLMLKLIAISPWVMGCSAGARPRDLAADPIQDRFRNIGLVLVVDAIPGAEMRGVEFLDDRGVKVYSSAVVAKRNREIMALGSRRVPVTVRIVWRNDPTPAWGKSGTIEYEGVIAGDYTIPVAERIPDAVLADIQSNGGALRLKFRLKPGGMLFGWDIQRKAPRGDVSIHEMPGGDFLETRY